MNYTAGLIADGTKLGARGHISCSKCQFRKCLDVLSGMREAVTYKNAENQEQENREQISGVRSKSSVYVHGNRHYFKRPFKAGPYHVSMNDDALRFWHLRLRNDVLVASINYRSVPPFLFYLPGTKT